MQQVVAPADGGQQAARARQRGMGQGWPGGIQQIGLAEAGKPKKVAEVVVAAAGHQLLVGDAGFLLEGPQRLAGHAGVVQHAGWVAGGALGQAAADFSQ